ncbi:MAG: Addiction module component, CHP02574 [Planctomycetota bacterium]|nr:MAG: Addiction module component, CHP02574 [Planctomycetota bacterium]REJ91581.1 MAG: Addiction module component, CHP02574 [Planctomycetota bacterium]REK23079.1 MAG: Addiction module component, CHP02574 [Planctomycetota bacterium]
MNPSFDQIQHLPIADRLRLVEQIWDGIATADEPLLIQDWHRDEARRRSQDLDDDPDLAIDRDELWKRVDDDD